MAKTGPKTNKIYSIHCNVCGEYKPATSYKASTCLDCLDAGYKYCPRCDTTKQTNEFGRAKVNKDGYKSLCKECHSKTSWESTKKRYEDDEYRESRNKDSREFKARCCSTPEGRARYVQYTHAYRANLKGTYTVDEWTECLEDFDYACAYCGAEQNLTVDHIVAMSEGGWNYAFNLTVACRSCNSSKGASDVVEWYSKQPFYDETKLRNIHKRYRMLQDKLLKAVRGGDPIEQLRHE